MVDTNIILGGGIAVGGVVAGIGLVAFAENSESPSQEFTREAENTQAKRDSPATKNSCQLPIDNELLDKLEAALMESGGAEQEQLQLSEEDKKRIAEEADDGW
ncbi:hypothetical protein THAOC_26389 [Thalassiosira oceanica]|uniref:Uncharacterized protein n=1 Tax=Thalassiosira oceanica TaxID=159749 RepID=K0RK08_THAOC|nr:hypothetical protein THAOC_26389 [Thalassiosira oceanica]|eukprot:EJK54063.1 hypothetical protein THAOC_26389 [Thalassiosira oceanica]